MARSPGLCRASRIVLLVVSMYLLYLDESGSPNARHFVLAGVAIHETVALGYKTLDNTTLLRYSNCGWEGR